MSKKINKTPRRLLTASMSLALLISLSSCAGANNTINTNVDYASAGKYNVSSADIWNELQWKSNTILNEQITNVVLDKQISDIKAVLDSTKAEDKENKDYYQKRLVDYVVKDIYEQAFSKESYWEQLEEIKGDKNEIAIQKYVDRMYIQYHRYYLGSEQEFIDALLNAKKESGEDKENATYLAIAKEFMDTYYPLLAKELLAFQNLNEDIQEAMDKDDDPDDDKEGYFTHAQYKSMFERTYINKYDLDLVMIRFNSDEEYADTLRAFGLKVFNNKFYWIKGEDGQSYQEYIKYYDDLKSDDLTQENSEPIVPQAMLEIYVQIYNYMYEGYREALPTFIEGAVTNIDELRARTKEIQQKYNSDEADARYAEQKIKLERASYSSDKFDTRYTADELTDISSTFKTYLYQTLSDDLGNTQKRSYSTSTQSANGGYYIAYKFGDALDEETDENKKKFETYFKENPDLTSYEAMQYIMDKKENPGLLAEMDSLLKIDQLTETMITTAVDEAKKDVEIKIYNEALEITYSKDNPTYSKTHGGAPNNNVLATIKYEDTTKNLNIMADSKDDKSLKTVSGEYIGAYEVLEKKSGTTVAIDLITDQIVKDSAEYTKALADKETYEYYENFLEALLINFANGGLQAQGYSATIGKYNFLMLYFHTANVEEIIKDTYLVQHAASQLINDFSDDDLVSFFNEYTDIAYKNYFSLSGTRLVVYLDKDDNNEPDTDITWTDDEKVAAKELIYMIYQKLSASSTPHVDRLNQLVEEINKSARVEFEGNDIAPEKNWAKFKKMGLKVKTEEFASTNSDVEIDFALKNRLNDYARGYNLVETTDAEGNKVMVPGDEKYEYFKNGQAPTVYMEPLSSDSKRVENNDIVQTEDGFNLILVTTGTQKPSAEWKYSEKDEEALLKNITLKYNDKFFTIDDIENDPDTVSDEQLKGALNSKQIKLFILDNAINGSANLSPASTQSALTTFLQPVLSRYSSAESQRIVLTYFINGTTKSNLTFASDENNEYLEISTKINQNIVDSYNDIYGENNPNIFPNWWNGLEEVVQLMMGKKEAN